MREINKKFNFFNKVVMKLVLDLFQGYWWFNQNQNLNNNVNVNVGFYDFFFVLVLEFFVFVLKKVVYVIKDIVVSINFYVFIKNKFIFIFNIGGFGGGFVFKVFLVLFKKKKIFKFLKKGKRLEFKKKIVVLKKKFKVFKLKVFKSFLLKGFLFKGFLFKGFGGVGYGLFMNFVFNNNFFQNMMNVVGVYNNVRGKGVYMFNNNVGGI